MTDNQTQVAIIGAGIVGLAHAYWATRRGQRVTVFERNERAVGASIRNFGLIWPVGHAQGELYERALVGRQTWLDVARQAGVWVNENGSLHLAYARDELAVLEEYYETVGQHTGTTRLLTPAQIAETSPAARQEGLLGGLLSDTELTVFPRDAIGQIAGWLAESCGVEFHFGTSVRAIDMPYIETEHGDRWQAERVFVCSGTDFETLYPALFAKSGIVRCKLQMMRTVPQPEGWQLGATLCSGLTLIHYDAFAHCSTLPALRARLEAEMPEYIDWHIHVMVNQTPSGQLTIGDSHEYGDAVDPFDKEHVNQLILRYLQRFARVPNLEIAERWHGVYPKIPGQAAFICQPEPNVTLVNTFGTGMTLSFGLAQKHLAD